MRFQDYSAASAPAGYYEPKSDYAERPNVRAVRATPPADDDLGDIPV